MTFRVLSLGAGVQSTTLALMASYGEITPMPDVAIFADTGAEPTPVYEHLKWLQSGNVLQFPIVITSRGNIAADVLSSARTGSRISNPPFFTLNGANKGMLNRFCTRDYKIRAIKAKARELYESHFGRISKGCIEQWIGISSDEAIRKSESDVAYVVHRYPFLDKVIRPREPNGLWFSRTDCENWLRKHEFPIPPKSSCTFCPFRSNEQWIWLRDNDPKGWDSAVEIDEAIRGGIAGTNADALFVHEQCVPLAVANLTERSREPDLFNNECAGICGV